MNQPLALRLDKAEFLRWVEGQRGRYELVGGRVVMMTGGSRNHSHVMTGFAFALGAALDLGRWSIHTSELAIEVGEDIRYPDLLVEPAGLDGKARSTLDPVFVVEILSPSSIATDMEDKPSDYGALPSVACYIVAAQDEPKIWFWRRDDGGTLVRDAAPLRGRDATIDIPALNIRLTLADIYRFLPPQA